MKSASRIASLKVALEGIFYAIRHERNVQLHCIVAIAVLALSYALELNQIEYIVILLSIGTVLAGELMNTAIEILADSTTEEHCPKIKLVKDVAAGSVLVSAIIAAVIGCIIFIPKCVKVFLLWEGTL